MKRAGLTALLIMLHMLILVAEAQSQEAAGADGVPKRLEEIRRKKGVYRGEAVARYKSAQDYEEAKKQARRDALVELSGNIRVRVESIAVDVLQLKKGESSQEFKQLIKTKIAPTTLEGVEGEDFRDYPKPGELTYVVWLDRKVYDSQVKEEISRKRAAVESMIEDGLKAAAKRDLLGAIESLEQAKELYEEMQVPFNKDFDRDGKPDFAPAFIRRFYSGLARGVTISRLGAETGARALRFNTDGKIIDPVSVRVEAGPKDKRFAVSGAKLTVKVQAADKSKTLRLLKTGPDGSVRLPLKQLPASGERQASVQVIWERELDYNLGRATLVIPLVRIPLVMRSVTVLLDETAVNSGELTVKIDQLMGGHSMDVVAAPQAARKVDDALIEAARKATADFLLVAHLKVARAEAKALPSASATGSFDLYDVAAGRRVLSRRLNTYTRYGTTSRAAAESARGVGEKMLMDALTLQFKRFVLQREGKKEELAEADRQWQESILGAVEEGLTSLEKHDYATALDSLLRAWRRIELSGLDWHEDVDGDGQPDHVRAYIRRKLKEVVTSIRLRPFESDQIFYDGKGALVGGKQPEVAVEVTQPEGKPKPAVNLGLRATCVKGSAKVRPKVHTDHLGLATIRVNEIDPSTAGIVVVVQIDKDISDEIRRPPCQLILTRVPRMAVSIESTDKDLLPVPAQLREKIADILRERQYDVVKAGAESDYELKLKLAVKTEYVERFKLHKAQITLTGALSNVATGKTLFTLDSIQKRGYGTKAETAVRDVLPKVLDPLYVELTKKVVGEKL